MTAPVLTTTKDDEEEEAVTTMAAETVPATKPVRPTEEQQLLNEVESVYRRFMWMPTEHAYTVATLWVCHTHLRGNDGTFLARTTPRLYFGSKQAGCGKTMAMELTTLMSHNGEIVTEPTQHGLVTAISTDLATIGLDEIDLYFGARGTAKGGVRAVVNSGYKAGATVTRERNDEVDKRPVHAPMALAGKNANRFMTSEAFETLRTRSIAILLERKPVGTEMVKYRSERHEKHLRSIAARLRRWGSHHGKKVTGLDVEATMPRGIDNRDEEIWSPLFQVAAYVGGPWPARVEKAARALVLGEWGADDSPVLSPAQELLEATRAAFLPGEDFLAVSTLLTRLMTVAGWWRDDWANPHSAAMDLAMTLGTFGVEKSRATVNGKQARGYALVELLDEPVTDDWDDEEPAADDGEWDWSELDDLDD